MWVLVGVWFPSGNVERNLYTLPLPSVLSTDIWVSGGRIGRRRKLVPLIGRSFSCANISTISCSSADSLRWRHPLLKGRSRQLSARGVLPSLPISFPHRAPLALTLDYGQKKVTIADGVIDERNNQYITVREEEREAGREAKDEIVAVKLDGDPNAVEFLLFRSLVGELYFVSGRNNGWWNL
ncbi:hypothetical protein R1sor_026318 [Riccia sorocarpa]|uniref:Uncharacterized protein n=1 Tax=Riccia sorocarpa TaxID=122646 RepID=A0ABD3GE43_9MARC